WRKVDELRSDETIDLPTFSSQFSNEAALVDLKSRVVGQEMKLAGLKESLRDDAPEVVAAQTTLDTLRSLMRREVEARVAMCKARVDVMRARLEVLNRDYAARQAELVGVPDKEMSLNEMDHKIELLKTRYSELAKSSDQAKVTEQTTPSRNVVLLA